MGCKRFDSQMSALPLHEYSAWQRMLFWAAEGQHSQPKLSTLSSLGYTTQRKYIIKWVTILVCVNSQSG